MDDILTKGTVITPFLLANIILTWQTRPDLMCGQEHVMLDDINKSYVMESPNYPYEYPPHSHCKFRFQALPEHRVRVKFTAFNLEPANGRGVCTFDVLHINDDEIDKNTQHRWSFCGTNVPPNIITSGQNLYVLFISDSTTQASGFSALITIVSESFREPFLSPVDGSCTTLLEQSGGALYSPGFPHSYEAQQHCIYILSISDSKNRILMHFLSFEMESSYLCTWDYVEVHDGVSSIFPLIGRYCGKSEPPNIIKTSGPELYVVFHSDDAHNFKGFYAEYTSSEIGFPTTSSHKDLIPVCDFSHAPMINRGGIVVSNYSYPDETYRQGLDCSMVFLGSQLKDKIFINVVDMNTPDRQCHERGDFIKIIDGDLPNQTNLATLCGNTTGQYTSSFFNAVVQFTTDFTPQYGYKGFKLVFSVYYEDANGCVKNDFYCSNNRCIDASLKCDGYDHCGDNSDENIGHGCSRKRNEVAGVVAVLVSLCLMVLIGCICIIKTKKENKRIYPSSLESPPDQDMDVESIDSISTIAAFDKPSPNMSRPDTHYASPSYLTPANTPVMPNAVPNLQIKQTSISDVYETRCEGPGSPPNHLSNEMPYPDYTMSVASSLGVKPTAPQDDIVTPVNPRKERDHKQKRRRSQPSPGISSIMPLPPLFAPLGAKIKRNNTLPSLPPISKIIDDQSSPNANP